MLMLLLKSFVCAVVTLGVVFGIVMLGNLYDRLNDFGKVCFLSVLLIMILTFCFFCIFADI
jgi:hypothetical protein